AAPKPMIGTNITIQNMGFGAAGQNNGVTTGISVTNPANLATPATITGNLNLGNAARQFIVNDTYVSNPATDFMVNASISGTSAATLLIINTPAQTAAFGSAMLGIGAVDLAANNTFQASGSGALTVGGSAAASGAAGANTSAAGTVYLEGSNLY